MPPPSGIGLDSKILRLYKALYGLKDTQLQWFEKLASVLYDRGFISLPFLSYVFINYKLKVILVVYVDNITTVGKGSHIKVIIDYLKSHFKVTVKGGLKYILVFELTTTENGIEFSQRQYITNIPSRFGIENCGPIQTTIDSKTPLVKADGFEPLYERISYQKIDGSLIHLVTSTCPDLPFSVSYISHFSSHPLKCLHTSAKRIFCYHAGIQCIVVK